MTEVLDCHGMWKNLSVQLLAVQLQIQTLLLILSYLLPVAFCLFPLTKLANN